MSNAFFVLKIHVSFQDIKVQSLKVQLAIYEHREAYVSSIK